MAIKAETENLITLTAINKSYQQTNGQKITIIENISLTLRTVKIVALFGT